ncbi:MAG: RNA polymerase subunit sigma-70, partial [Dysgonamonadaceae bacterium]|nr:RNA polymerase subunit sigma-70 [Dysgonamonadaceae bacterium]
MEIEQYKNNILPLRNNLIQYAGNLLNNADEAEDIVQEVLLKLWYIRSKLKNYKNLPGLAMTITKNLCINKLNDIRNKVVSLDNCLISFTDNQTPLQQLEE